MTRLPEFLRNPHLPVFMWLRFLTGQKIHQIYRHHFKTKSRDVRRERSLNTGPFPEATSDSLVNAFLDSASSPSKQAIKNECKIRLKEALEKLKPLDREVLGMRHFEQLSNREIAQVLNIEVIAARLRYIRALKRLRDDLGDLLPIF